ncbi:hypothetical protein HMPREF1527_01464 [Atopobium sp. oral taxon 199 str. F0494]|nr:hypothetical protein HMPREF1527_01464 [Atopobium sp. oral taxon 199 str. F0494]
MKVGTIKCYTILLVTIGVELVIMDKINLQKLPACPVETTLTFIGNKWQVLILRDLLGKGTLRFNELQRSVGKISQKVLTSNLRELEHAGIVRRKVYAEVPPRVEYSLTTTGQTLEPVLNALSSWGEQYKASQQRKVAQQHKVS